jgi:hypothetical protein
VTELATPIVGCHTSHRAISDSDFESLPSTAYPSSSYSPPSPASLIDCLWSRWRSRRLTAPPSTIGSSSHTDLLLSLTMASTTPQTAHHHVMLSHLSATLCHRCPSYRALHRCHRAGLLPARVRGRVIRSCKGLSFEKLSLWRPGQRYSFL